MARLSFLCFCFFLCGSCTTASEISSQVIKDNSTNCYLEQFLHITDASTLTTLSGYPGKPLSFLVGTEAGLVAVDDGKGQSRIDRLRDVEIRGMVGDADGNLLIAVKSKCVILSYDIANDNVTVPWAGVWEQCGDVTGSLASSRFGFLYDMAADANKEKFYVIENETAIKVIVPDEDEVHLAVNSFNSLLAMAVRNDGDIYFSASNAIYLMNKDDYTYSLVIGGENEPGHIDGSFITSRFRNITALAIVPSSNLIVAADPDNRVLRKINTLQQSVTSICAGTQAEGYLHECRLTRPTSLVYIGSSLMILDEQTIKAISCSARAAVETIKYSVQAVSEDGKLMLVKEDAGTFECHGEKMTRKETDQQIQCMMGCMMSGCYCLEITSSYCDIFIR